MRSIRISSLSSLQFLPSNLGSCEVQQNLVDNVPGAEGLPHTRLPEASHFLQDDQGAEIARRIIELIEATP